MWDLPISSFGVKISQAFLMATFQTNHGVAVISLSNSFCIVSNLFILGTEISVVQQEIGIGYR